MLQLKIEIVAESPGHPALLLPYKDEAGILGLSNK
jgi:hypothetical protein